MVNEVTKIVLKKRKNGESQHSNGNGGNFQSDDEHYIHNVVQDRSFMERHCIRQGKDCRYAIKRIQDSSRRDPQIFVNAVVDLAIEARFFSVIRHPNIIKMRAMEDASPFQSKFFLVLDRLYDIMPDRLKKWRKQKGGGLRKLFDLKGKKAAAFWVERLSVAYDIACALSYLHGLLYVIETV